MKTKSKVDSKQVFAIVMFLVFIGSTFSYAFFYTSGNSQNQKREFVFQNTFNVTVSQETIMNAITPVQDLNSYPEVPIERKIGGVWIEYSCTNCTELINNLTAIVDQYFPRVYLSPGNRPKAIYLQSNQDSLSMDNFSRTEIENFICANLILPPDACALRNIKPV